MKIVASLCAAIIGSYGFSFLFHLRGKKLLFAGIGGGLTWGLYLILESHITNTLILYMIVSVFATMYAEIMARINKAPATCFIMPAEISLVPGASLYYAMLAIVQANNELFNKYLKDTVEMALGLACGVVICSVCFKYIHRILNKLGSKECKQ